MDRPVNKLKPHLRKVIQCREIERRGTRKLWENSADTFFSRRLQDELKAAKKR
jgi:hypothetical protein